MNKVRRKELSRAIELLEQAKSIIEYCRDEEQNSYDNLPEGIQASDRGEMMDGYIYEMEGAMDAIDEAIDTIEGDVIQA